ncbi:putative ribose-5-phosphate isomerase chloroplastic [Hordeum vulgare]|nr:putative ribose-5-phosphate isomerase chloroplastic [Hordeum vulgare]
MAIDDEAAAATRDDSSGMDDEIIHIQESSDMFISSDDDGTKQHNESNVECVHEHGAAQPNVSIGDPELGMTFDTENEVREYYIKYAKAKGFGVTRRSSHSDDNGQLKYLTLSCSRFVAELGSMSDDSCNSLIEKLLTLKIEYSSNSILENDNDPVATQEDAPSNGEITSKTILSPIPVRCAGRPPSLRKESKVDKLIRQANEKKKKAEQREKKKAEQEKKKAEQRDKKKAEQEKRKAEQKSREVVDLEQGSFDLGTMTTNINPTLTAAIPYGGSSTTVMPPILGEYTSMLFHVQQGSTPADLHFDGVGGLHSRMDQN